MAAGLVVMPVSLGPVTAHLSFVPGEKTMTFYETPYGNIYLGIFSGAADFSRENFYLLTGRGVGDVFW